MNSLYLYRCHILRTDIFAMTNTYPDAGCDSKSNILVSFSLYSYVPGALY